MRSAVSPPRTRSRAAVPENADAQIGQARGLVAMIKSVCAALSPTSAGPTSPVIAIVPTESGLDRCDAKGVQAAMPALTLWQ